MEDKTILLKIELDTTSLTEGAKKAEDNLKKLVPELEKIGKESGKNTLEYKKLNAEVKANQKTLTDNATALQKYESLQKQNNGSLKEMRNLLSAAKVAYAELTKEERENAEIGGKLVKDMNDLNEELLQAEKEYGTHTRNVGNYVGALTDLKAEIKSLKGEMAGLDAGSEEYQKLANRAGELNDKLIEVNENTKANTGGTGFEKMSNNLGLVKNDLMNLDFAGVSEKMKQMAVISKSMTFSEVLGGIKNMGSALVSFGKALLANPLFLLVGAITAIGVALFEWNNSVKKEAVDAQKKHVDALDKTFNAMLRNQEMAQKSRDLNIRLAELEGKSAKEIGEMRLKDQLKQLNDGYDQQEKNNERIRQLKKLALRQAEAGEEEEAKATQDKVVAIREANRQLYANEQTFWKQRKILKLEIAQETKAEAEAEIEENKAKLERIKQANKTAYEERLALARKIRDIQLNELNLSLQNERAVIEANYKFLEDSAQGNAQHLLDIEEDKNKELQAIDDRERQQRLDRIKEDFDRQVTDAKGNQKLITEINKLREEENEAIDIEYKNKATERQTAYNNKLKELNKTRAENERKTADEIELIDAELFALKTKGTDQEIYATLNLYAIKKKQIEEAGKREIELTNAVGKEKERIEKETQLKLQQLKDATFNKSVDQAKKETEMTLEQKKSLAISMVNSATQLADSLMQISRNQIQTELNEEKDKFDAQTQLLNNQLAQGIISQANFNAQKSALDAEYIQKEKELKLKQFQSNKASQLINATIATAVGVANALAAPPPLGLIMAGISGALGAAQIAIIASQPTPKFAKGGILNGASHVNGGIPTPYGELEGGEAVINKRSTRLFTPLLSAINEAGGGVKFANGGILQPMVNSVDSSFQLSNMIIQSLRNMPNPIVSVQEIIGVQNRVASVVDRATF
jgi:hypothetical protein